MEHALMGVKLAGKAGSVMVSLYIPGTCIDLGAVMAAIKW
jgi:hypothetical protein